MIELQMKQQERTRGGEQLVALTPVGVPSYQRCDDAHNNDLPLPKSTYHEPGSAR